MKRLAWMAALAVALVVAAAYGWNPQREEVRAQGGGAQSYSLPVVMRMPTLTPIVTPTATPVPPPPPITRVSIASDGAQADHHSNFPAISADGRFVAFSSWATTLVSNDTNNLPDVFVHDRVLKTTVRVSVSADGTQANHSSAAPSLSADGRYVAFSSAASNLVPGDSNSKVDVFVRDLWTGDISIVSLTSEGDQGNNDSGGPSISADGRYIAFASPATNLVVGDTNGTLDIFVRDRVIGQTKRVSVSSTGAQGNNESRMASISLEGQVIVFESIANNLVPNDTNQSRDIFAHDLQTGLTTRVSVNSQGNQTTFSGLGSFWPSVSSDGRYVAFESTASNLIANDNNDSTDIFIHDRDTHQTEIISVAANSTLGNGNSNYADISSDGRYVTFFSMTNNIGCGGQLLRSKVVLKDRQTGAASCISGDVASSAPPVISGTGRFVTFGSQEPLVPEDTNIKTDIFVHDRTPGAP